MSKPGFGKLMSLKEAMNIAFDNLPDLGTEKITLNEASGRVLATPVTAEIDVPGFAKAAMDGFAVRAQDTFGASETSPLKLKVVGSVTPGFISNREVGPGECIEISTGAPIPDGADATLMVENTEIQGEEILVYKAVTPYENYIKTGSDIGLGTKILSEGIELAPRHLGALAAAGVKAVEVKRNPKVSLMSTGDELVEPGSELGPGKIYDINTTTLGLSLKRFGCEIVNMGVIRDTLEEVQNAIAGALRESDIIVLSGGSSLGRGDFVPQVLGEAGKMLFHGIAVKPGKPTAMGVKGNKLIFGMPGYPTSALSNFYIILEPVLEKLCGKKVDKCYVSAAIDRKVVSSIGRYQFLPVQLEGGRAIPVMKGSSSITSLANADGFVEIEENVEVVEKDTEVKVRLF